MTASRSCGCQARRGRRALQRRVVLAGVLAAADASATGFGAVSGRVLNVTTRDYVSSAEVRLQGTELSVTTASDGSYRLTPVPAGPAVITVSYTGTKPAQVALAWLLARGEDIVPIPGTKRRAYLEINVAASYLMLSAAELATLDALGNASGARYTERMMQMIER